MRNFKAMLFRMINEALDINENDGGDFQLSDLCLFVDRDRDDIEMVIYNGKGLIESVNNLPKDAQAGLASGYMRIFNEGLYDGMFIARMTLSGPRKREDAEVFCMDAWEVSTSSVYPDWQGKKLGRLLYGFAMMTVSPEPIMADRSSVSSKARKVWKSMESNPAIKKLPSNDGPFTGEFDDEEDPITAPLEDDCFVHRLGGPDEGPLNKAYAYDGKDENKQLYQLMKENHETFLEELERITGIRKKDVPDALSTVGAALFRIAYNMGRD